MKFDSPARVLDILWDMRKAEQERANDRIIINRHFNGEPPFTETEAEELGVQVNRNMLKGVQVIGDARRQWNQAMISDDKYFTCTLEEGPAHKTSDYSAIVTREINRQLKKSRGMLEQARGTGANLLMHGPAPTAWRDNENPIPEVLPISSLLIPGETTIDFENLDHFFIFREWTPYQLYCMTHGKVVDTAWNVKVADAALKKVMSEMRKEIKDDQPERLDEMLKQDGGFFGSDTVPTVNAWDLYFREGKEGEGWYRRIILDTALSGTDALRSQGEDEQFIYNTKNRQYAANLGEILHVNFGDCSADAPFKYHSVRSLAWMLWGACDLLNRLECRTFESVFENLMWIFQAVNANDFNRVRKADFHHLGVIPAGIKFVPQSERFTPNPNLIDQARSSLRQQIAETASSYTQSLDKGDSRTELTATETMARVNSVNALVAGIMSLAYAYEDMKYQEIFRRFMLEDNSTPMVKNARERILRKVSSKYLDPELWSVKAVRVIGAGNKAVQMGAVSFLQSIRGNVGPEAQRKIDHISIAAATDQPNLADELAPLNLKTVSQWTHDAELASDRILRGFAFSPTDTMVYEDYVLAWLKDLAVAVQQAMETQGTPATVAGLNNMGKHIGTFLGLMGQNKADQQKIRTYAEQLGQIMNHVKGIEQRMMEAAKAQQAQGGEGGDPSAAVKAAEAAQMAQIKLQNAKESHADKTAQRQVTFEMEQARKDREQAAELARKNEQFAVDLAQQQAMAEKQKQTTPKEDK